MEWCDTDRPGSFDPAFIESVNNYYEAHGIITTGQRNALDNIVDKFEIDVENYL